ncbi:hypothetical protein [Pseudomonas sp. GM_Psu_2]|uniref:hypothetical protein n=1 Tax=unclassified Pseudomonas TaxID=196821 RepID=UPI002269B589|nr:hypothetical protein [Pseudomonas sp. GM_Psu_2]
MTKLTEKDPVEESAKLAVKAHPPIMQEAVQDLSKLKERDPQTPDSSSAEGTDFDPSRSGAETLEEKTEAEKESIEHELASARGELERWKWHSIEREDGSPAQERRNEEIGESLRERVRDLEDKLNSFK